MQNTLKNFYEWSKWEGIMHNILLLLIIYILYLFFVNKKERRLLIIYNIDFINCISFSCVSMISFANFFNLGLLVLLYIL